MTSTAQQKQQELLKQVAEQQFIPKDPPPEFEFIADPPSISALDLCILKLILYLIFSNIQLFAGILSNLQHNLLLATDDSF